MLAVSPKSRLACDFLSICDYDRSLDPLKRKLAQAEDRELASTATDRSCPKAHRMIAAWLFAGTARFPGTTMPKIARDRKDFMRLLASKRLPLAYYYIADRAAARIADPMFVSMLPIAAMMADEQAIDMTRNPQVSVATISGFPAAAFDLHTYEGRLALTRFGRECPPVRTALQQLTPTMRDVAIRHGVFIAEGGCLTEQLRFEVADQIEDEAHDAELAFAGLRGRARQAEFVFAIRQHLDELNWLRRGALNGM